jgi:hypothetical protein
MSKNSFLAGNKLIDIKELRLRATTAGRSNSIRRSGLAERVAEVYRGSTYEF